MVLWLLDFYSITEFPVYPQQAHEQIFSTLDLRVSFVGIESAPFDMGGNPKIGKHPKMDGL